MCFVSGARFDGIQAVRTVDLILVNPKLLFVLEVERVVDRSELLEGASEVVVLWRLHLLMSLYQEISCECSK